MNNLTVAKIGPQIAYETAGSLAVNSSESAGTCAFSTGETAGSVASSAPSSSSGGSFSAIA